MWARAGLIGDTGFVGGILARDIPFSRTYNSRTINQIAGEKFDVLVCAGAPATMWAANSNPQADRENLQCLASALAECTAGRVILISTIAVFDDSSAGYTETNARYETAKAYGKHRRELEVHIMDRFKAVVLRLPALFGLGLKKNFIFDIMNPIPSFIQPKRFDELQRALAPDEKALLNDVFAFDEQTSMHKLDRSKLEEGAARQQLEQAFARIGFLAINFTNSDSHYQYYNLAHLKRDIETAAASGVKVVNICSEPWRAGELYVALKQAEFINNGPQVVREDVRTEYAQVFGRLGPYLYSKGEILTDLSKFIAGGTR
jgi:hypothetical protein